VANSLSLEELYEGLLEPLEFEEDEDLLDHMLMMLQIRTALDEFPELECDLYLMSGGRTRERAISAAGSIDQLFQGANPGTGYPGDREIRDPERFTVQVHHLDLHHRDRNPAQSNVRVVAVHVPEPFRKDGAFQPNT
jgi:hypothetical protein